MSSDGIVPLDAVLRTEELQRRLSRPIDYEKENRALAALMHALSDSPRTILQTLSDLILELFDAGSAGVSLLTTEEAANGFTGPPSRASGSRTSGAARHARSALAEMYWIRTGRCSSHISSDGIPIWRA
jgi:hypothetical protein